MPHDKSFATFLDERLRERDLNLKKLSELSGITFRHLECLREGSFAHLPAAPYVRGYLKKLAGILDFDADAWWHELEYESTIQRSGRGDELPKNRFALQSLSGYGWMALIALLAVLYIGFRFSVVFGTPQLTLAYPKDAITRVSPPRNFFAVTSMVFSPGWSERDFSHAPSGRVRTTSSFTKRESPPPSFPAITMVAVATPLIASL